MCKFMSEIQCLIGRRPMRSYSSWGTRHHCPMEVGAFANTWVDMSLLLYVRQWWRCAALRRVVSRCETSVSGCSECPTATERSRSTGRRLADLQQRTSVQLRNSPSDILTIGYREPATKSWKFWAPLIPALCRKFATNCPPTFVTHHAAAKKYRRECSWCYHDAYVVEVNSGYLL